MGNTFRYQTTLRTCALSLMCLLVTAHGRTAAANPKLEELAQRLGVRVLADATSDRDVLKSAKSRIPYSRMSQRSQQRTKDILDDLSQYRRMPCLQYEVNPDIYQYLINHPDVAISTWRVMGISELVMNQTGPFEYEASAADGSTGIADILWRDGNQCLFIVEGTYQSPLLPGAIQASALVWLQYRFVPGNDGKVLVNQQVETFVKFPSTAVDTLAKLASVVTNTILDRNVFEVSLYARMMSTAAEKEPEWLEQLAMRMENVAPERRLELIQVSRGRRPNGGRLLPAVSDVARPADAQLARSAEFQAFETSMRQINTHVPLVVSEVQHEPSYGQHIGATNAQMAPPARYLPEEAVRTLAEKEERQRRTMQYNEYYANPDAKGVPSVLAVAEVPPSLHRPTQSALGELMTDAPALSYSETSDRLRDHGKAASALPPVSPSRPLTKSVANDKNRAVTPNLNAKPVSQSNPLTTEAIDLTLE
ncbi:MAG: hypothetical protein R3C59_31465 [Planctomycetaceae bacterium]